MPVFRKLGDEEIKFIERPIVRNYRGRPKKGATKSTFEYICDNGCKVDVMTYDPNKTIVICGKHKTTCKPMEI